MANGTIRRRKNGSWEVRVYTGRDPVTGRPLQKSRTVHGGKRKAEDALRALHDEIAGQPTKATRGTVAHLMTRWLAHVDGQVADESLSPATQVVYRSTSKRIVAELGDVALADLTAEHLDTFYEQLRAAGLAPATISKHHAVLSRALALAVRWRWIPASPAALATKPRARAKDPDPPTVTQVHRLLELAEQRNPTLAAFLFAATTTGARRGELCAVRWSNVDLVAGTLTVTGSVADLNDRLVLKDTKTHQPRRLALDEATVAVLVRHRSAQAQSAADHGVTLAGDPFVFSQQPDGGSPYRPKRISAFVYHLRAEADLPELRLHHLRHFMATHALAAGMDVRTVAGRLGHANPAVTLRVYGHFLEERDRELADSMGRLLAVPIRAE